MSARKYLFIDGGHLRKYFVDGLRDWMGVLKPTDIDFSSVIQTAGAIKSFYYDCQDDTQLPDEYFTAIRRVSGSHVRYGTLKGKSNKGRERRQKEIDILLAVDMMNHAMRKNIDEAILLAGDMDFVPVVESLVEMGCFVRVMADARHVAQELIEAADDFYELEFKDYHRVASEELRNKYPIPRRISSLMLPTEQGYTFLKSGQCAGKDIELYKMMRPGSEQEYFIRNDNHSSLLNRVYKDLERLELFYKLQFEEIKWN